MNTENQKYLEDQLKFSGFGEIFKETNIAKIFQQGAQEVQFELTKKINEKETHLTLYFFKPDNKDVYYFRKYEISINHAENLEIGKQTFFVDNRTNNKELQNANNFSLKEAFNLMEGRSVEKSFTNQSKELYTTWVKLNFTDRDKWGNYPFSKKGFDLEPKLNKLHAQITILECKDPMYKIDLLNALRRGNLQTFNTEVRGTKEKYFLAVDLAGQGFKCYDTNLQPVDLKVLAPAKQMSEGKSQGENQGGKQKESKKQDEEGAAKLGPRKPKGARIS